MRYSQSLILGALLIVLAEFCMATMGALVKALGETMPLEMAVFARNLAGLLAMSSLLFLHKGLSLRTPCFHLHLVRGLAGVSAMYCFFYAIIHIPLADSMLLKMTAPLFMPVIALLWLQEGVSNWTVYALVTGFVGVWLVVDPTGDVNWVALVGIAGGFLAGIAKVSIRRLARTEPNVRVVFYFALIGTLVSILPALLNWKTPGAESLLIMVAIGVVGTAGQFALTRGYSVANAGTVAPLTYFSVIFGGLYGYFLWQEIPTQNFILGALLIAAAGLLTLKKKSTPAAGME